MHGRFGVAFAVFMFLGLVTVDGPYFWHRHGIQLRRPGLPCDNLLSEAAPSAFFKFTGSPPMSFPKRFQDQADNDLPLELQELGELISSLSGSESLQIQAAYKRVTESVLRRRRILGIVQEALSQLRLDVKYLMFDLEVTRRERDELQSRIEGEEREY